MKHLFIVRHAKSSWKNLALDDFDRPLNKRGKHDAPLMGKKLAEKEIQPELIISSSAVRAKKTAKKIAKQINHRSKDILYKRKVYETSESGLIKLIKAQPAKLNAIMLVGHNPELTNFSNLLCHKYIYNIPTTGIVHIQFEISEWKKLKEKSGEFISFIYPKMFYEVINS